MQRITEILRDRLVTRFYTDCPSGQLVRTSRDTWRFRFSRKVESLGVHELMDLFMEHIDQPTAQSFLSTFRVDPDRPELADATREMLETIVVGAMVERESGILEDTLDCGEYKYCYLCPSGERLFARELHDYIMGGAR